MAAFGSRQVLQRIVRYGIIPIYIIILYLLGPLGIVSIVIIAPIAIEGVHCGRRDTYIYIRLVSLFSIDTRVISFL
jgi:hypothetical protein